MAQRFNLTPGKKICTNCQKRYMGMDTKDMDVDDEEYICRDYEMDVLNDSAKALDCTPVKKSVGKKHKLAYSKRKVKQINKALKVKCARVLEIPSGDLDSTDSDPDTTTGNADLDRLMSLVKEKLQNSTRKEKIRLLTLAPESWSQERTAKEFNVTLHMVKTARQLKKDRGILSEVAPKQGKTLSSDIVEKVVEFYQSDNHSRMCPGKKDFVTIRVDGEKTHVQKRLLLLNLKEIHVDFCKCNPNDKIGFSKFCELRPKHCISVTAPGMHSVCVCEIHQNAKLIATAIPGRVDYKELLSRVVCSTENRDCMLHLCGDCPGKDALHTYLTELFASQDYDIDDTISYKQWLHTDRTTLATLNVPIHDFIDTASDSFNSVRQHHFIAKAQSTYLRELKDNLKPDEICMLLDFAENYGFIIQDAAQGHHWDNSQATLHPFVAYYRQDDQPHCISVCIVSDCMKHDTTAVHAFLSTTLAHLKRSIPGISKVHYFSDGAASQYKNFKNFSNLCHHKADHGVEAEWNFFATSHGKSPCDGIGGTVKRLVARASLQAAVDNQILTPQQMYEWASNNIPGVTFFFVTADDVAKNAVTYDLPTRFSDAKTLLGSRSHHAFLPVSSFELKMKRISADDKFTIAKVGNKRDNCDESTADDITDQLHPGKYVACLYDSKCYVGSIIERSDEHNDVRVNFMNRTATGLLCWPPASRRDECWLPFEHVLCLIDAPQVQGHSARYYVLSSHDDTLIKQKMNDM